MTIGYGEIIGLLGSSRCGKTSTLRMIAAFEEVREGQIRLGDWVVNRLPPVRRNVAMAFEGYALHPPLTIRDNIAVGLLRDRRPKAEVDARVRQIAELLAIGEILDRYPPTVSGGQAQRTSLARALVRALVRDADLFLLDEPMGQLEPRLRAVLRARIKDGIIERRLTTIIVAHHQTELALCNRIADMEAGVFQQLATPHELKDRPANLFVASLIGEPPRNIFEARIERDGAAAAGLRLVAQGPTSTDAFALDLPTAGDGEQLPAVLGDRRRVHLGIRTHLIAVGERGALAGSAASNQWLGDQTHLGLDVGGCLVIAVADGAIDTPLGDAGGMTRRGDLSSSSTPHLDGEGGGLRAGRAPSRGPVAAQRLRDHPWRRGRAGHGPDLGRRRPDPARARPDGRGLGPAHRRVRGDGPG